MTSKDEYFVNGLIVFECICVFICPQRHHARSFIRWLATRYKWMVVICIRVTSTTSTCDRSIRHEYWLFVLLFFISSHLEYFIAFWFLVLFSIIICLLFHQAHCCYRFKSWNCVSSRHYHVLFLFALFFHFILPVSHMHPSIHRTHYKLK